MCTSAISLGWRKICTLFSISWITETCFWLTHSPKLVSISTSIKEIKMHYMEAMLVVVCSSVCSIIEYIQPNRRLYMYVRCCTFALFEITQCIVGRTATIYSSFENLCNRFSSLQNMLTITHSLTKRARANSRTHFVQPKQTNLTKSFTKN